MADFYKQNGSYFTTQGQKVANLDELNKLSQAGGKEIDMPSIPTGATKISGPSGLQGLTERQLFRQGQDIYKLPDIDTTLDVEQQAPDVPEPEPEPDITSQYMAGLDTGQEGLQAILEQINKPLPETKEQTEIEKRTGELAEEKAQVQETALDRAEEFGLTENTKNLQSIMPQMAKIKASYDNAEIAQEGRQGLAGSIYGRQALIQKQRAIELAGLGAIAQAYQGNIQLAQQTAQDMVDMELAPIQTRIDNQLFQLEQVKGRLTDSQNQKAQSLELVLAERQREIDDEKEKKTNIANLGITAAQNGASQNIVESIMNAETYSDAIVKAKDYLNIDTGSNIPQSIGNDSNGNELFYDPNTKTVKTADQLTSFQLGVQVGTINGLPSYNTRETNPGVNRSDRNNNPGNIKVSDYTKEFEGVAGVESSPAEDGGHFLIFESPEDGINAIGRLLLEGNSYQNVNAETAIKKYNGGGSYGALELGLDPNKSFQEQIQGEAKRYEVARNIAMLEGWSGPVIGEEIVIPQQVKDLTKLVTDGKYTEKEALSEVDDIHKDALLNELANIVAPQDTKDDIIAKEKATLATQLKNHKGLINAVGPIDISRMAPFQWGQKQDFIGSVEQLVSDLSLESLIEAKSRGATFGALSDSEMRILASAATKIGTWRIMDKNGEVKGYRITEKAFKEELDNISKIYKRAISQNIQEIDNNISQSTPIMSGETSTGMGWTVTE